MDFVWSDKVKDISFLADFVDVYQNARSVRADTGQELVLGSRQIVQLAMFRHVHTLDVVPVLTYFVHAIAFVLSSHLSVGFLVHRVGLVLPVLVSGFSAFGEGVFWHVPSPVDCKSCLVVQCSWPVLVRTQPGWLLSWKLYSLPLSLLRWVQTSYWFRNLYVALAGVFSVAVSKLRLVKLHDSQDLLER